MKRYAGTVNRTRNGVLETVKVSGTVPANVEDVDAWVGLDIALAGHTVGDGWTVSTYQIEVK